MYISRGADLSELSVSGQFDCAVGAGSVAVKNSTSGAPVRAYNIVQRFWNAHLRKFTVDPRAKPIRCNWCALCYTLYSCRPSCTLYLEQLLTSSLCEYWASFDRHVCEGLRNYLSWSAAFSTCVCVNNWRIGKVKSPMTPLRFESPGRTWRRSWRRIF